MKVWKIGYVQVGVKALGVLQEQVDFLKLFDLAAVPVPYQIMKKAAELQSHVQGYPLNYQTTCV